MQSIDHEVLLQPVSKHMRRDYISLDVSSTVVEAARLMKSRGYGSVIVTRDNEPVGIVTERDILYKVVAEGRDPKITKLEEIMSWPLITVTPQTLVVEALATMSSKGIRRLVVVEGNRVVGMLSQLALVGDVIGKTPVVPEVEAEKLIRCPYCNSKFELVSDLSKHIDDVHIMEDLSSVGMKPVAETYIKIKGRRVK
ncbi:MAG: CBS domain-containing protein [Aigarchaeota archaeon]|nr:CBS domain-containing protein [Aigarchaeota archaeon]MDW8093050.1 CBS domain-containing protein [Nitrososphaerota archaeon]